MEGDAIIREEMASDVEGTRGVHEGAFETVLEADLVDNLRRSGKALVSLVAEIDGEVVGHVLFSPVTLVSEGKTIIGAGLAPIAVAPRFQKRGIGKRLIRQGLNACRLKGRPFVVVLGEPGYYGQFGFLKASRFGVQNEYGVDEEFMVVELQKGSLPPEGGLVKYGPEFAESET